MKRDLPNWIKNIIDKKYLYEKDKKDINKINLIQTIVISIFAMLLGIVATAYTNYGGYKNQLSYNWQPSINSDLKVVDDVYNSILDSYYQEIDKNTLLQSAINGMVSSLDDVHTTYFDSKQTKEFTDMVEGNYVGIGVEILQKSDGNVMVSRVFKDSPAFSSGILINDVFTEVDGQNVLGKTPTEIASLVRGEENTTVNVTFNRNGESISLNIGRVKLNAPSVNSKIIDKDNQKIGYIELSSFNSSTYNDIKSSLEELMNSGISGLILDVRSNSGGYLTSVSKILELFLDKNQIIYQLSDKENIQPFVNTKDPIYTGKIAVLQNIASASASEILSVSLSENKNVSIIGTRSYGKGTVQITKNLVDGSMLKMTIQKWLSPKGNWINEIGVLPTDEVEFNADYLTNPTDENDNQLQKAIEVLLNK